MGAASMGLLMMVSLEAALLLLVAGTSARGGGTTIRFPSDARGEQLGLVDCVLDQSALAQPDNRFARVLQQKSSLLILSAGRWRGARAKLVGDEKRPWECCDLTICTRSYPPICQCLDEVERCSHACKDCVETEV
jgi:hypothetical protein